MTMSLLVSHRSSASENSGHHQQQQPGPFYSDNRSSQIWGNLARPPLWRGTPSSTSSSSFSFVSSPLSSSSPSSSVLLSSSLRYPSLEPKDPLQSETLWKNAQKAEEEEATTSEGHASLVSDVPLSSSRFSSQSISNDAYREFQIGAVNPQSRKAGILFGDVGMFSQAPKNDGFPRWNDTFLNARPYGLVPDVGNTEPSSMFSDSSNSNTLQKNDGCLFRDGIPKVSDDSPKGSYKGANYGNMASRVTFSEKNNGFLPNDGFPNVGNDFSKACWQGPQYGTVHELPSAAALSCSFPSLQPSPIWCTQVATSATGLLSTLSPVTTIDAPATSLTNSATLSCTNLSTENIDCSRSVRLKGMRPSDQKAKIPDIFTFGSCGQSSTGFRAGHASQKLRHRSGKVTRPPRAISAKASAAVKHTVIGDASNVFSMSASTTSASCSETTQFGIVLPDNDPSYRREFSSASKINDFAFTQVSPVLDILRHNGTSTSTPSSTSCSASNDIGRTASGFEFLARCNKVQETEASKLDAMQSVEQQIRFWNPFSPIGDGGFKEDRVKIQSSSLSYGISDRLEGNITHFPNETAARDTYGEDVTGFDSSYPTISMGNDSCGAAHGLGTSGNQASKTFSHLVPVMPTETRHDQNYNILLVEPSSFQGSPSELGGTQGLSSSSIPGKQSKEPFAFTGSKAKNEESFLFRASSPTSSQDVGHVQSAADFCGLDSSDLSGCRSDVPISMREIPSTVDVTFCMPTLGSLFESLSLRGRAPANTGDNCKAASQSSEPFEFRASSSFPPFSKSSIFSFAPSAVAYNCNGESKPADSLSSAEPLASQSPPVTDESQLEDNTSTVDVTLCMPTLGSSFESLSLRGRVPANTGDNCKAASQSSEPFEFRASSSFPPFSKSSIFSFAPSAVAYNRNGESNPADSLSSAEPLASQSPPVTDESQLEDNNSTVDVTLCMPTLGSSFESLSLRGRVLANTGDNCKAASQSSEPFEFRASSSFTPFSKSSIFSFAPSAVAYNCNGESKPADSLSSAEPLASQSPPVTDESQLEDNVSLNASHIFEFQGSNKYSFPRRRSNVRHLRANLQRQGRYFRSQGNMHRAPHSRKPHMESVDETGEESDNSKDKWNHLFDEDLEAELLLDATAELTIGAKGAATKEESFIGDLRIAAKNLKLGDKQEAVSAKSSYGAYEEVNEGNNSYEQAPTSTQSWFEDLKVRTENLKIQDEQEAYTRKSCYEGDQEGSRGKTGDEQATTIEKSQLFDGLKGGYDEVSGEHIWRSSKEEESMCDGLDNVLRTISKERINEVQKDVCGYTSQSFSDNNQGKHFTFNATSCTSRRHTRKSYGGRAKSVKLGSSSAAVTSKLESRESTPNMGVASPQTTHDVREMDVGMDNVVAGRGLPSACSASISSCSKNAHEPAAGNAGLVETITPASPPSMKSTATERLCERWRLRGNEAYANGEFSKAEKCYSRGLNVVSATEVSESCKRAAMLCYSNRAATRMALGRIREALGDCTCAMTVDPKFFRVRLRAANCHLALGEVGYAVSFFKGCLSSEEGEDSDPKIVIEAHEGSKKAQQLDEYSTRAKELLANYDSAGDALCLLNQALLISPYSEHLLEMKAQALLSLRRYNEVIKLCEQSIAPAERNHSDQERQHLLNPAANYSKGTSVRSGNIALISWRCKMSAKAVFLLGRVEESIAILSKSEEIRIDSSASSAGNIVESFAPIIANLRDLLHHKAAGNEAFKAGNYVEAIEHYSAALICNGESRPFNAICFCNRAAASQALGHITDAIADCSRAIALNPNYYKAISRRSTLHEMIRDYGQACQDLRRLITLYEEEENRLGRSGNNVAKDLKQTRERLVKAEEEMRKDNPPDHYLILGVDPSCSSHEIKKAYKRAALKHHPDKACQFLVRNDLVDDGSAWKEVGDDIRRDAEHLFKMIGEAYAVLSDSAKRLRYDTDEELRKLKGRGSGIRFASSDSQVPRYEKSGKHRDRRAYWTGYAHKYQRWQTGPDAAQTDTYSFKDNYTWNGFKSKHNGYKDDADFDWNDL